MFKPEKKAHIFQVLTYNSSLYDILYVIFLQKGSSLVIFDIYFNTFTHFICFLSYILHISGLNPYHIEESVESKPPHIPQEPH